LATPCHLSLFPKNG